LPIELMESVTALGLGPMQFILVVMFVIFILGMFLETIAIILITTPIVLPALMQFDVNLIWYGILLMINLELALITPPVGMNLFVIKGIANAPLAEVIRGVLPYVVLMLIGLALVLLFEPLAVNAGPKLHRTPERKCTIWLDLAGVKLRQLVGFRFVHGPARRSAPTKQRSFAGLWSNRGAVFALQALRDCRLCLRR